MSHEVKKSGGYRMTVGCALLSISLIILMPLAMTAMENGSASTVLFIAAGIVAVVGIALMLNGWKTRKQFDNRVLSYDNASEHDGEPAPPPPMHARRAGWADRPANHMGNNTLGPDPKARDRN